MMRQVVFVGLMAAAAAALFAGCSTTTEKANLGEKRAEIMMQAGIEALQYKDYGTALRNFNEAAKSDPKNPTIYTNMGIAYAGKADNGRAEESWRKAIQLDPKYYDAYLNLGILYQRNKHYPEAERMLKEAGKDPSYEKLHLVAYHQALIQLELGKPLQAEQQLKIAVRENPGFCGAWLRLGRMQKERGDYSEAARSLKSAVMGTCYKNPEAHYEIASLYMKTSETALAKTKFLEVIQLFPQSDWAKKSEATLNMIR